MDQHRKFVKMIHDWKKKNSKKKLTELARQDPSIFQFWITDYSVAGQDIDLNGAFRAANISWTIPGGAVSAGIEPGFAGPARELTSKSICPNMSYEDIASSLQALSDARDKIQRQQAFLEGSIYVKLPTCSIRRPRKMGDLEPQLADWRMNYPPPTA